MDPVRHPAPPLTLLDGRLLLLRPLDPPAAPDEEAWLALDLATAEPLVLETTAGEARRPLRLHPLTVAAAPGAGTATGYQVTLEPARPVAELDAAPELGGWPLAGLVASLAAPSRAAGQDPAPAGGGKPTAPPERAGSLAEGRLLAELDDPDPEVRLHAASRLGKEGGTRAVTRLIDCLADEHPDVRRYAAEALGRLGDGRAGAPLRRLLADPDRWAAQWAAGALHRLGDDPRQHGYQGDILLVNEDGEEQRVEP